MVFKIIFILITMSSLTKSDNVFTRLQNDLFKDGRYDKDAIPMRSPPAEDNRHAINVSVGLSVISLDLSPSGVLSSNTWLRTFWHDYRLQWSPADYQGVKSIRVPPSQVWKPDLSVYNAASVGCDNFEERLASSPALAIIYSSGDVLWMPPISVDVFCNLVEDSDGEARCAIKLGSWTYDGNHINLTAFGGSEELDLSEMSPDSAYTITSQTGNGLTTSYYPCCEEPYPAMDYRFTVEKVPRFTDQETESSEESSEEEEEEEEKKK